MSILGIRHRQLNKCRSIDIDHRVPVQKWSIYRPPQSKNGRKMVYRPSRSRSTVEIEVQLRKPEADEEFYAADFETLGQEDEVDKVSSEVKAPLLGGMDGEYDKELSLYDHPGEGNAPRGLGP